MTNFENLCDFDVSVDLKLKGFDDYCEYTYYNNYRVRDEIYEKHPGLSDCGYMDLTKRYDGPYEHDEVYGHYIEPLKLSSRNSTIGINPVTKLEVPTNALCSCPTLYDANNWLVTKGFFVSVSYKPDTWEYSVIDLKTGDAVSKHIFFENQYVALLEGIKDALTYVK